MNTLSLIKTQPSNELLVIEKKQDSTTTIKPKQFAVVDMWNIQKQRKMIFRRSA